jgi:hypothetical protein
MRRFTAFIFLILILFIVMVLLGIFLKNKLTDDTVHFVNLTIELYEIDSDTDEKIEPPYQTVYLGTGDDLDSMENIFKDLTEITASEFPTGETSNCVMTLHYKQSTYDNLYTATYQLWYDDDQSEQIYVEKNSTYYLLTQQQSKEFYRIINAN